MEREIPCLISDDLFCVEGTHRLCTRAYEFYELRKDDDDG